MQTRFAPVYRTAAYNAGIEQGKERERSIFHSLKTNCGWSLEVPNDWRQDAFNATDAILVNSDGSKTPVQIKARKQGVGDDIGYEIAKNYNANDPNDPPSPQEMLQTLNGRDMRGAAKLTAVLSQTGDKITIIDTNEGHDIILKAVQSWLKYLSLFADHPKMIQRNMRQYTINATQLLYKYDLRDNYWKIVAYISPNAFKKSKICNLNNRIDTRFN